MKDPVFTGVCPALVTPFDEGGAVNYDTFAELVERQISGGVSALCVCGTTGESATLSDAEQAALTAFCVRQAGGRVKVIAGAGSNDTVRALKRSLSAQDAGADALLLVAPYYNKTTQVGLVKHFTYIADRVELPIILYNVPSRTGVSFTADTYEILSRHPRICGVKEASGQLELITHTRRLCPPEFTIWSGNDDQVVPLMALGAKGVISVAANLIPEAMAELTGLCLSGDFRTAARLQIQYAELMSALFCEVNPIPVKTALDLMGYPVGALRLPLCEMDPRHLATLKNALEQVALLGA